MSLLTATEIAIVAAHVQVFLKNFSKRRERQDNAFFVRRTETQSFPSHKKSPEQPHSAGLCQVSLRDALFVVN